MAIFAHVQNLPATAVLGNLAKNLDILGNLGTPSAKIAIDFEWEKSRMCQFDVPRFPKTAVFQLR